MIGATIFTGCVGGVTCISHYVHCKLNVSRQISIQISVVRSLLRYSSLSAPIYLIPAAAVHLTERTLM